MSYYSEQQYRTDNSYEKFYYELFFKKGDRILDVGCSTGNFIAQDPGNIIGADVDPDALSIAKKRGYRVHLMKNGKLPFKQNSFDNVHCKHVLEHLSSPLPFLMELRRVMKKNGKLVLLTDKPTPHFWDDYTHQKPFTETSLKRIAYDSGFRSFSVYSFPSRGIFGAGKLHSSGLLSPSSAKAIYKIYGKLSGNSIVLEAIK